MAEIIPRGRGKWLVRVFLGRDEATGKRHFTNRTISGTKKNAETWAADRERERDLAGPVAVRALDLTVGGLLNDLELDYQVNGKRGLAWCKDVVRVHLRPHFGKMPVSKVTTDEWRQYQAGRLKAGAANATINREMALLRRAFNLAAKADPPKVARVPRFTLLEENNVRQGFFEDADYRALLPALPEYLRPVLAFGYFTGCRRGEILMLRWGQVDLIEGVVRLEPGTTKNRQARGLPLAGDLLDMMRLQRARRDAECPGCEWVFFHGAGQRVKNFKNAWSRACFAAGLWEGDEATGKATKLFHDLRRSGVRNLVRSGVSEKVAMTISGHKTRAVFERYNVTSEDDLKRAGRQLQDYLNARRALEMEEAERAGCHTMVTQATERPS